MTRWQLPASGRRQSDTHHLTCRPSGGRDCCSRLFPRRSSSSRAELPEVEADKVGWERVWGSGLRSRLGAAGISASVLSEDWRRKCVCVCVWRAEQFFRKTAVWLVDWNLRSTLHSPGRSPTLWSLQAVRGGWRCVFLRLILTHTHTHTPN